MKTNIVLTLYQKPQTIFTFGEIALLFPQISNNNLKRRISYHANTGKLKRIRKGLYAKLQFNPRELTTKLYTPSYISFETVLEEKGIIFQHYEEIFTASYLTRKITVENYQISYRRIKDFILTNRQGITDNQIYPTATVERAFLDAVYTYKNYHFDNLSILDWEKVKKLQDIYQNKALEKRVAQYYKLSKNNA